MIRVKSYPLFPATVHLLQTDNRQTTTRPRQLGRPLSLQLSGGWESSLVHE